jgi:UDP-2,4-diacetamido-2,4,6-trideoxy-beta-L-altropyranose hydrolase
MDVAIRTDSSHEIGSGHVIRCLTLAKALRAAGARVAFICREHPGHLCDLIEKRGFEVARLTADNESHELDSTHTRWLGASWQVDVAEMLGALDALGLSPGGLIADHYAIDRRWEEAVRSHVDRIMVIDDLADRQHDCDLLLDQNLVGGMRSRYDSRLPEDCHRLLGPKYALLQPEYAATRKAVSPRTGPPRRILLSFGGADVDNVTARALDAVLREGGDDLLVDVVFSATSPHASFLQERFGDNPRVAAHYDLPTLAPLIATADLALGAGGATHWERLCLGLPSLVVTLANNQQAVTEELARRGLIRWIGHNGADFPLPAGTIAQALRQAQRESLESWSQRCLAVVDGAGVERVCRELIGTDEELTRRVPVQGS